MQHLIILTALEEMITERKQQAGGSHASSSMMTGSRATPNEYFAAIMTALEANDQSHTPEVC